LHRSLGEPGGPLDDVSDADLAHAVGARASLVSDIGRIESALMGTLQQDVRTALTIRRSEIVASQRAAADAAAKPQPVQGGLTVVIPPGISLTTLYTQYRTVHARVDEQGRRVIDLLRPEWTTLAMSADAPVWIEANLEIHQSLDLVHTTPAVPTHNTIG
jgi:hypothetical protein